MQPLTPDPAPPDSALSDLLFLQWLIDACGYRDPRPLGDGRYACIAPMAFTHAILVGRIGDMAGYGDRWCYRDYSAARCALDAWDGRGEPVGWHRHPDSGRRVSVSGEEVDADGAKVGAVGVTYVRY